MTGEDLRYKPGVVEKAKFEYSPLGKVFNKRLDESDKKEGIFKRLKNLEGKNEEQLESIKDHGERQLDITDKQEKKQLKAINKQEEQLRKIKDKKTTKEKIEKEKESREIVLLRDNLNDIVMNFDMNFSNE